jgi:multidrug resistance protein MdtO
MAPPANETPDSFFERPESFFERIVARLAPFPGRLEFATRLALICALTVLVAEIYQTPEPALATYVAFFVMKPDRAASIVTSIIMLLLISLIVGLVLAITMQVIEQPLWRVSAMALVSFCLTFAASASKLKPVAGIVALITAYALDLVGSVPGGETATRGILYVWLFIGIPAGVCIAVNLVLGPAPRRLAERALAHRLRAAAALLGTPDAIAWRAFEECLHEGPGEIPEWLKLAGAERTSPGQDIAALQQANRAMIVILSAVDVLAGGPKPLLAASVRLRVAETLAGMAAILDKGGYPVEVELQRGEDEAALAPLAEAALVELRTALAAFAMPPPPDPPAQPAAEPAATPKGGFFLPDAFSNPAHVHYALKTTGAAMFCYVVYMLLDWPGIHTCLITCYIVSLGTAAETVEKQTLRVVGCGIGAVAGLVAIVFLMPNVTSIGGLMGIVFLAALVSGWIAAGGPRISYLGLQLAFAFFLSVIQGAAPAFDMTIARDRTIGILFGDLVVAIVFTQLWPVSIARHVDSAIAGLLRQVAALAAAASTAKRWGIAADARTQLASVQQDLALTHYEPPSIRPAPAWLNDRREIARTLSSLQGLLVMSGDQQPGDQAGTAHRLERLADRFGDTSGLAAAVPAGAAPGGAGPQPRPAAQGAIAAAVETRLANLERRVGEFSEPAAQGTTDYAPAS